MFLTNYASGLYLIDSDILIRFSLVTKNEEICQRCFSRSVKMGCWYCSHQGSSFSNDTLVLIVVDVSMHATRGQVQILGIFGGIDISHSGRLSCWKPVWTLLVAFSPRWVKAHNNDWDQVQVLSIIGGLDTSHLQTFTWRNQIWMLLGAFFPREDKVHNDIDDHVQGLGVYGGINNPHLQPLIFKKSNFQFECCWSHSPKSNWNVVGHTLPNG